MGLRKSFLPEIRYWAPDEWKPSLTFGNRDYGKGECIICGAEFTKVQSDQITCGKLGCQIKRNKEKQKEARERKKRRQNGIIISMEQEGPRKESDLPPIYSDDAQ